MGWLALLLGILKWLGITLAVILIVLIILILIILLAPVRYEAKGKYTHEDREAYACVKWLFGIVCLKAEYKEGKGSYGIRCPFRNRLYRLIMGEEPKEMASSEKKDKSSKPKGEDTRLSIASVTPVREEASGERVKEHKPDKKSKPSKRNKTTAKAKNKSVLDRIRELKDKLVAYYNEYDVKHLIDPAKRLIRGLIRAAGLKRAKVRLTFGFDDPSLTGMVLGATSVVEAMQPLDIDLRGYFEGEYLRAIGSLKGGTCLLRMVIPVVIFLLNKPVRQALFKLLDEI